MALHFDPELLTLRNQQGRMIMKRDQKGFTLIEVIVIIIIVGLLGAIAIPRYISLTKAAERGNVESVIGSLRSALNLYSAHQIVNMLPITSHNPFDDLGVRPPNYAGAFGDVDLSNCPSGYWAYQSGDPVNGNWGVVCYRPNATLTQAFGWGGVQWIILVVNPVQNANLVTIGLSLDYYPPVPIW
jgi:prepilin-type N-terminal cleavage/methylation domain-containing protein